MKTSFSLASFPVLLGLAWYAPASAQMLLQPPYAAHYSLLDLGEAPGVPTPYGGMTFKTNDPNTLLLAGGANTASGQLFAVGVVRDADGHITGFTGTTRLFCDAPYNDGGVAYGPGGVLFLARYPDNALSEIKPGHMTVDRVVDLSLHNVSESPGGLNFIPAGWPNAGRLIICGYEDGRFYSVGLKADALGTYGVTNATFETQIDARPEGFIYVPPGSVLFSNYNAMLVCNYRDGRIDAFNLTPNGAPQPGSRSTFISGLSGAEGAVIDPVSGDFLFSTFSGGDHLVAVRGFNRAPTVAVTAPTNNTTWPCCLQHTVTAEASDDGEVRKLELYVDNAKFAEAIRSPLTVPWETNRPGAYVLTARGTDNGGVTSTSAPVLVNIVAPPMNTLIAAGFVTNRSFRLCGNGETNWNCVLQATSNWDGWNTLGAMVRTNGILEYYDTGASNFPWRFYRMSH